MFKINHTQVLITTIIVIGFLLSLATYYFYNAPESIPENGEKETIAELDTSDWLTYENKEYGYRFKYPPTWYVVNDALSGTITVSVFPEDDSLYATDVGIMSGFLIRKDPDRYAAMIDTTDQFAGKDMSAMSYTNNNISGTLYRYTDDFSGEIINELVYNSPEGVIYVASYVSGTVYNDDFENIMKSLQLIN